MPDRAFAKPALVALLVLELLYLALVFSIEDRAHFGVSLLFLGAVWWLLVEEPANTMTPPSLAWRLAGIALMLGSAAVCFTLWQQQLDTTEKHPLRLLPMAMLGGVLLWAGGWQAIGRHGNKLLALFFLGGPHLLLWYFHVPDTLALWSAGSASYLLWYAGFDVATQGAYIQVNGATVLITPECAGSDTITYLLGIALLAMLLFPPPRRAWLAVFLAAVIVAFCTNVVRIAALALANAGDDPGVFHYWHSSEGAQLFGVVAIGVFAAIYYLAQRYWWEPARG